MLTEQKKTETKCLPLCIRIGINLVRVLVDSEHELCTENTEDSRSGDLSGQTSDHEIDAGLAFTRCVGKRCQSSPSSLQAQGQEVTTYE